MPLVSSLKDQSKLPKSLLSDGQCLDRLMSCLKPFDFNDFSLKPTNYLRATFCKIDTKSSNLIFDPSRFCSCSVKISALVRNLKITKLSSIGHVVYKLWTPQVCHTVHSECKIRCEPYFEME